MKIRTKFRLVSLCIVLIVVGVVAAVFLVARREVTKKIKNQLELVGDQQLERVRDVVERNFERLEQVSSRPALQESVANFLRSSAEDQRDDMTDILGEAQRAVEQDFREVCIIDLEGKVIGSSDLGRIDAPLAEERFFLERESFKERVESANGRSVSFDVIEGRLEVVLSEPFSVEIDGEIGYIVIRMNGENLAAATLGGEEPIQTMLLKQDADGGVLVLTPPEYAGVPEFDVADDSPLVMAAIGSSGFQADVHDQFRDVRVLAVTRNLGAEGLDLGLVATMERSVAFEGLRRILTQSLILLGLALVAMELALRAFSKGILQPVQRLAQTANEISGGDLSRRVEISGDDEIGELGRDFNQMTERLIEANSGLERKVEERTAELEQSNADLAQFAYVASHDLKEPLRMVTSYVQLLERRLGKDLDEESKEFMGFAVDGAMRMRGLIDDLLAYSRVGTKRKPLERVSAQKIIDAALMNLKVAIDESGATVEVGEMPDLMADSTQLTQLFQNLIANAIKFRGERKPVVKVTADRVGNLWNFEVSDNGIGIAEEYLDQIFLIFQRLHNRSEYEGTGIGLAVCKKIVERHGGRIGVRSKPGQGSTFFFGIHAAPGPATAEAAAASLVGDSSLSADG